jgi:hypothetical protein
MFLHLTVVTRRLLLMNTPSIIMLPGITNIYGHLHSSSGYYWIFIIKGFRLLIITIPAKVHTGIRHTYGNH